MYNMSLVNGLGYNGPVAQLVEQFPLKELVQGSSPCGLTFCKSEAKRNSQLLCIYITMLKVFQSL